MNRIIVIVSALIVLISVPVLSLGSYAIVTSGKFNFSNLEDQREICSEGQCDGCLAEYFPDWPNAFSDSDDYLCNQIKENILRGYYLGDFFGDWRHFFCLFVQKATLQATIDQCHQNYGSPNCEHMIGETLYSFDGAYLIGSELDLGMLDPYIDRDQTGRPNGPYCGPWSDLHRFVEMAANDPGITSNWEAVFAGALWYFAELTTEPYVPAKDVSDDIEFTKKVIVHAMVCWQDPDWENGVAALDVITPSGIVGWPFVVADTPTFVFNISDEMSDIFSLPVGNEQLPWGGVKAIFR